MTAPPVQIAGFSSTSKVPGAVAEVVYGAGPINAASIPLICLMIGLQGATGTATANQDVNLITSSDQAATLYVQGTELAVMCQRALAVSGIVLKAAGVPEAGGAAAGTLTITITLSAGSNPLTNGTELYWIGGRFYPIDFNTTDTPTSIALALCNKINSDVRAPFTAAPIAGVATVTTITKGVRANDYIGFQDVTKAVGTNVVSTITGGTAVTGGGKHFTGGSGADTVATVLTVLFPGTYDFVAAAQYDATNAALFLAHSQQKAGPLEMRPSRFHYGYTGTLTNATSLAQTTLNDQRSAVLWYLNGESVPSEIAAVAAAERCQLTQADPNANFDGLVMPGIVPQRQTLDWAQRATQEAALSAGVTPLATVGNTVQIVRAIGTHSLNGTTPDYRTLDWGDDYVPDFIRLDTVLFYQTDFGNPKTGNTRVADDVDPSQRERPAGVATPSKWSAAVQARLNRYEKQGPNGPLPILVNTAINLVTSGYDRVAKRIMSLIPCEVMPNQHAIGLSIRQIVSG